MQPKGIQDPYIDNKKGENMYKEINSTSNRIKETWNVQKMLKVVHNDVNPAENSE